MKALIDQGPDFLMELFRMAMNEAMRLEREAFLNAGAYERIEGRLGYANGFKPKTVKMRSGSVALSIPQIRDCDFYPRSLTKGLRSERALTLAMAEMYVQGVSTRKVKNILENKPAFRNGGNRLTGAGNTPGLGGLLLYLPFKRQTQEGIYYERLVDRWSRIHCIAHDY